MVCDGMRRKRCFREAATKYLMDNAHEPSIGRAAPALKDMDSCIRGEHSHYVFTWQDHQGAA
jgi:hypothetical protein